MMRGLVLGGLLLAVGPGCKTGGENADPEETKTGTDTTRGSAGGFSAGLSADLALGGSGSSGSSAPATPVLAAGSDVAAGSGSGSGSGSAAASGAAVAAGSGSAKTAGSGAGSAGSGAAVHAKVEAKPAAGSGSAVAAKVETPVVPPPKPVELTPEMKMIKLSLQPNWVRDVVGPGTISLEVNVQSRDLKTVFRFDYGYESDKAPTDRDLYKKYLADTKQMSVTTDRQRGAAWYLEGPDGSGKFSFKIVVLYGGKRLICGGSSYKESDLGDIRDQVVIQAKSICETIAL